MQITITGQTPAQKNNKTVGTNRFTGKVFVTSNPRVKEWQKEADKQIKMFDYRFEKPVALDIQIWNKDNRARDLDNQVSSILDALVKASILVDDSCKYVNQILVSFRGVEKENPKAVITFYEAN